MCDSGDSLNVDADLLYCEILREIVNEISDLKISSLVTIKDFITCYSKLLNFVTSQPYIENIEKQRENIFYKLFSVEKYILSFLSDPELLSILDAINGKYKNTKFRNEISLCSQEYYKNSISTLNCEQDVESLIFKYYKANVKDYSPIDLEYLLLILFIRKEYTRFYKIYKKVQHSVFTNRLAILLSLNEDCEFNIQNENVKITSFINILDIEKEVPDIFRLTFLENEDFSTWKTGINFNYDWNEKVRLWMKNRCESSCLLDKSMIEECIKHKRFEDGWIIYEFGNKSITEEFQKISILCISALRHLDDDIWTERLIEVMNSAIDKHDLNICCDLVQDIFHQIGGVSEKQRSRIIRQFIKKIRIMENNEEIVTYIIKGINELCKKCINTETCDLCVAHANLIYKEWKKNNTGGFFFKSHSKYESEIYENMLDMCDTIEDCKGFKNVCRDLVDNEAKINRGIYEKLQVVHSKTCRTCRHGNCQVLQVKSQQQLLNHIFNGFHL